MNYDNALATEADPCVYTCQQCGGTDDVQLCIVNREDIDLCSECRALTHCGACGDKHEDCLCDDDTAVDSEPYDFESMDGDHASALESAYGPDNDAPDYAAEE